MLHSRQSRYLLLALTLSVFTFDSVAQTALEEIIVTARKRDESYSDVPVSVTAFTEADIEASGIETPADYITRTPNITMVETQNQGTSFITIRGISQARNSEPSAAVLIDGVLMANPSQFNQELFDIEQIEVLRGSQGALYGRNAIGGVITVRTKEPADEFEGRVTLGADSGPGFKVVAGASGPAPGIDNLKYRASFSYKDTEGYIDNPYLNDEADPYRDISGRVKLLWQPTDNFTADFRFSISQVDTQALYFNIAAEADDTSLPVRVNNPGENPRDMYNVSLKMDYDNNYGTFTSITSYDDLEELLTGDQFNFLPRSESFANFFADLGLGGFPDPTAQFFAFLKTLNGGQVIDLSQTQFLDTSSWSQEFRFTSPSENRLRWIAGAYFIATNRYISTGNQIDRGNGVFPVYRTPRPSVFTNPTDPSPQLGLLEDAQDNFAWAVFGAVSYDITDRLEGTIALRYDEDTRENTTLTKPLYDPTLGLTTQGEVREHTWDDWQPKFTLRWMPSDNITIYGDYSHGFRSGGFNQSGVGAAVPTPGIEDLFEQETADTFEAGIKMQVFDNRVDLRLSGYMTDAEGSYFFFFDPGTSTQNLGNLDEVSYSGIEFEGLALVTEGLNINLGLGITDSEIDAAADPTQVGNEAPLVSEYTLNVGGQYRRSIAEFGGLDAFIRLDYMVIGDTYWDPNNLSVRSPVDLMDLRAGIESPDNWSLTFWSRNLLDEEYNAEFSPGPAPGAHFLFKAAPMRWGVDFTKRF
jgi:iron complex outermembrane receptor protein